MTQTAPVLALVHDQHLERAPLHLGLVGTALQTAGAPVRFETLFARPDADHLPDPATLRAVVVTGSEASVYDDTIDWIPREIEYVRAAVAVGTPVLGVCFGGQLLAAALGGRVVPAETPEHGFRTLDTGDPDLIPPGPWVEWHADRFEVPPSGRVLATTRDAVQAFVHGPHLGVQFHPEMTSDSLAMWREVTDRLVERRAPRTPVAAEHVAAVRAEIADRLPELTARCAVLVDGLLARAAQPRRSAELPAERLAQ